MVSMMHSQVQTTADTTSNNWDRLLSCEVQADAKERAVTVNVTVEYEQLYKYIWWTQQRKVDWVRYSNNNRGNTYEVLNLADISYLHGLQLE
jgi:hypothetical protein